ncbi:MAG TPA: hypothetical protein VN367_08090 [Chlorobaculum sp.]|jgi:uncharacterized protein YlxW (UPF0749 family)|nr:hypothetical protein [Chlorobaculum sp.]
MNKLNISSLAAFIGMMTFTMQTVYADAEFWRQKDQEQMQIQREQHDQDMEKLELKEDAKIRREEEKTEQERLKLYQEEVKRDRQRLKNKQYRKYTPPPPQPRGDVIIINR